MKLLKQILIINICKFIFHLKFKVFDKDHDGLVTLSEIKETILSTGIEMTEDMLASVIGKEAINFDGLLSYYFYQRHHFTSFQGGGRGFARLFPSSIEIN